MFHELGRCYLELGGNEDARNFGVRSLTAADEISDEKWKIMAIVLISQAECKYILLLFPTLVTFIMFWLVSFYSFLKICSSIFTRDL